MTRALLTILVLATAAFLWVAIADHMERRLRLRRLRQDVAESELADTWDLLTVEWGGRLGRPEIEVVHLRRKGDGSTVSRRV